MLDPWLLVLQVALPLAMLGWVGTSRRASDAAWVARVIVATAWLVTLASAGLWLSLPVWLLYLYLVVLAVTVLWTGRSQRAGGHAAASRRSLVAHSLLALAAVALAAYALAGRRAPAARTVDVAFPLDGGTYLVANGGSIPLLNAHVGTLEEARFRAYRGQSYGVDVVRLFPSGLRASGVLPADPAAYAIFGDPVTAPCSGRVVIAEDGAADQRPPRPDRTRMAGNHVVLECGDAWVVLAHFRRGSVRVRAGEHVNAGRLLGVVGNSGNSQEPHLHIHAQTPGTEAAPLSGDPLVLTFAGRYLARNARVTS